jgi:hypothetical protein
MLRGRNEIKPGALAAADGNSSSAGFPTANRAYDERQVGILFYQAKESFFLPYHLLQSVNYRDGKIKIFFATDEVALTGRGLHELYVQIAGQKAGCVVERGERYAAVSDDSMLVIRIERTPRSEQKKEQQQGLD